MEQAKESLAHIMYIQKNEKKKNAQHPLSETSFWLKHWRGIILHSDIKPGRHSIAKLNTYQIDAGATFVILSFSTDQ